MRRLPAEWEPQSGVMLTWPHSDSDWRDDLERVQRLWAQLAAAISRFERVLNVCRDPELAERAQADALVAGADPERLHFVLAPSEDTWARDHGPLTAIRDGQPLLLDFRFNGWGQKFPFDKDDAINRRIGAEGAFGEHPMERSDLVLEGGAIETDGAGTLLAVERTLVDPLRNPGLSRTDLESALRKLLGIRHFLWLRQGQISGDDTDGHIDTLARFCDPRTICYARCEDREDADYAALAAMEAELGALRDPEGKPYRMVPLPCPSPVYEIVEDAPPRRLPAGYANFLILNGAVLVPTYRDRADGEALAVLAGLFAGREVLGLDCRPLIRKGGSLHCVTMQLPAGVLA